MRDMRVRIVPWIALALAASATSAPVAAQTWRTMTSERQVWSTEPASLEIRYGAGTLRMEPAESPTLYRMDLRYDEDSSRPVIDYDESARRIRLGIESRGDRRNLRDGATATIAVTRDVPLDLDFEFGAGEAELDLGGLSLRRLEISTGASETTVRFDTPNRVDADHVLIEAGAADLRVVGLGNTRAERIEFSGGVGATLLDFSGSWPHDGHVSVEMGIGSITLRLPRSQGVRVNRSSFLTRFSAPGLDRRGDSYYSANWETAPTRLTFDIQAALGAIKIEWVD